jgi:uncharacterized protein YqjF (DUF2071 family)
VRRAFLTARWEDLVILNFEVPPVALATLVPRGTTLDLWDGHALVSLVGFLFADTRVRGLSIPGHREFEEVNLRFYVRRRMDAEPDRRAVVFVRELVPRYAIAAIARIVYNEPYLSVPMRHRTRVDSARGGSIEYAWRYGGNEFSLEASVDGAAQILVPGSEAEFITEHYWGYTRQRDSGTLEYEVEHPRWRVWPAPRVTFRGPATTLYGRVFGEILMRPPRSAFVADGSRVTVYAGQRIAD